MVSCRLLARLTLNNILAHSQYGQADACLLVSPNNAVSFPTSSSIYLFFSAPSPSPHFSSSLSLSLSLYTPSHFNLRICSYIHSTALPQSFDFFSPIQFCTFHRILIGLQSIRDFETFPLFSISTSEDHKCYENLFSLIPFAISVSSLSNFKQNPAIKMASFENLASIDTWAFRPAFADSWFADALARDTESFTKALQKSLSGPDPETLTSDMISPFLNITKPDTTPTSTVSGLSGSDQETPTSKRQRNSIPGATGKVSKRKSRASKRSQTTFITADPANFRQMVQQVTGVRFGNSQLQMAPILKPEPQRPGSRLQLAGGCLPTLDTSALLLDHHHQQQAAASTSSAVAVISGPAPLPFPPPVGGVDGAAGFGSGGGIDFDPFPSFPTLDSWKVM